eukprot:maker-scaffold77_size404793-snap-gene-2.16 protein:Tk04780 transcript:maker-scaffold77_size404793-snap-gene-2.16-mRNA-1 annotation:"serine protease easter precursor"
MVVTTCFLAFSMVCSMSWHCAWSCQTIPTESGTPTPQACLFPFIYRGLVYNKCTSDYDPEVKPWCSVRLNSEGEHVSGDGGWGHCDITTCLETPPPDDKSVGNQTQCQTLGQRSPGIKPCVLPFILQGVVFNTCTTVLDPQNRLWCSLKTDSEGIHVKGNWDYCFCSAANDRSEPSAPQVDNEDTNPLELINKPDSFCGSETKINTNFPTAGDFLPDLENCGRNDDTQFIVGGHDAKPGEFPFAATIGYDTETSDGRKIVYKCGGSLINSRYVLTAAHCLDPRSKFVEVKLGEQDFKQDCDCLQPLQGITGPCMPPPQRIRIEEAIQHKDYNGQRGLFKNDIGLVRLSESAVISQSVRPVCLPINPQRVAAALDIRNLAEDLTSNETNTLIIGWGKVAFNDTLDQSKTNVITSVLQTAEVPIQSHGDCSSKRRRERIDQRSQLCAGIQGRDSCNGDSGGPLLKRAANAMMIQFGIVSYGDKKCANGRPAVYTRPAEGGLAADAVLKL